MAGCPDCPPAGAPAWMATFADLITLLMTFFVLLYATSQQDASKFESVAGSIRNAFAGNSRNMGEVIQLGKSPDDSPTMIDAQEESSPFPIDFQTTEGLLDKYEINRATDEDLKIMKKTISEYGLTDFIDIYEMNEGIKIEFKDKIYFKLGTTQILSINVEVFEKLIRMLTDNSWFIYIEAHSSVGEVSASDESIDAYELSSLRANAVTKSLVKRGVPPERIIPTFYGDARPSEHENSSRVEFILRKIDGNKGGKKVSPF